MGASLGPVADAHSLENGAPSRAEVLPTVYLSKCRAQHIPKGERGVCRVDPHLANSLEDRGAPDCSYGQRIQIPQIRRCSHVWPLKHHSCFAEKGPCHVPFYG